MIYMYKLADIQLNSCTPPFRLYEIITLSSIVIAAVSTSIKETVGNYSSKKSKEAW